MANEGPLGFVDANNRPLQPDTMRPSFGAAGIVSLSLGAGVTESAIPTAVRNSGGDAMMRLASDANGAYYAFGPAGGAFTGAEDMCLIPPNTIERVRIAALDVKVYHLQLGAGGALQVAALG